MCQFMPLFANHSDYLSRNFICKNFIAQSDNIKTSFYRRESKMLFLHFSWSWALIMRAFHSLTFSSATSSSCRRSSSLSLLFILEEYFTMTEWIRWIASLSASQSLHEILWNIMVVATICAIIDVSGIAQGESSTVVGTLVSRFAVVSMGPLQV